MPTNVVNCFFQSHLLGKFTLSSSRLRVVIYNIKLNCTVNCYKYGLNWHLGIPLLKLSTNLIRKKEEIFLYKKCYIMFILWYGIIYRFFFLKIFFLFCWLMKDERNLYSLFRCMWTALGRLYHNGLDRNGIDKNQTCDYPETTIIIYILPTRPLLSK